MSLIKHLGSGIWVKDVNDKCEGNPNTKVLIKEFSEKFLLRKTPVTHPTNFTS